MIQRITPFLWFNDQAEEAMALYVSNFKNSRIVHIDRYGEGSKKDKTVMSGTFELDGQEFVAFNGGPEFNFSPAISLYVHCKNQEEVDRLWENLSVGGQKGRCGWLTDRYGVSWQIVPTILFRYLRDHDKAKADRVMKAMIEMDKLDIELLKKAYKGQ